MSEDQIKVGLKVRRLNIISSTRIIEIRLEIIEVDEEDKTLVKCRNLETGEEGYFAVSELILGKITYVSAHPNLDPI